MKRTILLLGLLSMTTSIEAQNFYAGVSLGVSQFDGIADTDTAIVGTLPTLPANLPLNGIPFDGSESNWGVFGGWEINDWLAIQAGYSELGNHETKIGSVFAVPGGASGVALGVDELHLAAKVRARVSKRLTTTGLLGITRASFDAQGGFAIGFNPVTAIPGVPALIPDPSAFVTTMLPPDLAASLILNPSLIIGDPFFLSIPQLRVPVSTPQDETGLIWGAGMEIDVNDSVAIDVSFRQHDTRVLKIDTWSVGLIAKF